jgi:hypothetical protein
VRRYAYLGPEELAVGGPAPRVHSRADVVAFVAASQERVGALVPATFVIGVDGALRLAPRGSEHVACAGGADVLAAGELYFDGPEVVGASNQSTGYCPEPASWPAVAAALDRLGVQHPGEFTSVFSFRVCGSCGQLNVVKDPWCAACGAAW